MLRTTLITGFLLSCGAPADHSNDIVYDPCEPVVVLPGEGTTAQQLEGIRNAIELWRLAGLRSLTLDPDAGTQRVPVHFRDAPSMFHGIYEPRIGEVRVNTRMVARAMDLTIAHELGHAVGLAHIPHAERLSVMNPGNSTVAPTTDDERQLHTRWSCLPSP